MLTKPTFRFLVFAVTAVAQKIDLGPELSADQAFLSSRFTQCNNFVKTCFPGKAACASVICDECTMLGQTALNACCAQDAAPTDCLETALRLPGSAQATETVDGTSTSEQAASSTTTFNDEATITSAATVLGGVVACDRVQSTRSVCDSLSPGVLSSTFLFLAPCACYDGHHKFAPGAYDNPFSECLRYQSTVNPDVIASLPTLVLQTGDYRFQLSAVQEREEACLQ